MNKYTIIARSIRLVSGKLKLTAEQAKTRLPKLKALEKGIYEIVHAVEFKCGEIIGYDGDLPKSLSYLMMDNNSVAARKGKGKPKPKPVTKEPDPPSGAQDLTPSDPDTQQNDPESQQTKTDE